VAKLPAVSGRQAVSAFEAAGFSVARSRGDHIIMTKPGHPATLRRARSSPTEGRHPSSIDPKSRPDRRGVPGAAMPTNWARLPGACPACPPQEGARPKEPAGEDRQPHRERGPGGQPRGVRHHFKAAGDDRVGLSPKPHDGHLHSPSAEIPWLL
jgi:hypothetical protein